MNPRALSDQDYRSLAQFRHSLRVFLRFSEEAARAAGITPAQHQLLLAVKGWEGKDHPSFSELAEFLQLRLHSTVELVQRAEAAGLVRRTTDPSDGRRQLLQLTAGGERKLAELSLLHREELWRFRSQMDELLRPMQQSDAS